jgi:hypothetical protein
MLFTFLVNSFGLSGLYGMNVTAFHRDCWACLSVLFHKLRSLFIKCFLLGHLL